MKRISILGGVSSCVVWLAAAEAQVPAKYAGNCTDAGCHGDYARREFLHGPTSVGACDACHVEVSKQDHRFRLTAQGADLCAFCHLESYPGKVRHRPVADGQCVQCHDPHGGSSKLFLKAPTVAQLCQQCHEGVTEGRTFLHGPVAAGSCTACHDPHASDHDGMLFAPKKDVCGKCHTEVRTQLSSRAYVHQPVNDDCSACHDAHGANDRMMLKASQPDLCFQCHEDMAEQIRAATVSHQAVSADDSCANCHDPHASDFEHVLRRDPMGLCLSCHDKTLPDDEGKTIGDMKTLFKENPSHHGPIAQGQCSGCHQTHGGSRFRLLVMDYPPEFYASYEESRYALCFQCHEADLVRDERTDRLTNFRNGDQNLHYLHVHREKKGRTCRACHDVHASRQPNHLRESVPFGNWAIPINFAKTATGGSCQPGCHKPYSYDRNQPVMNIEKPTAALPAPGITASPE